MRVITHRRLPPEDAQRELQEAFPECFYEWLPRAHRWAVKRRVPWNEVERLVSEKKLTVADIEAHMEARYREGFEDAGDALIVHAFTVQDPDTGEPIEPGSWVVEALKRADTQRMPGGVRQALKEVLERRKQHEREIEQWYTDQIEQAVEHFDPWLRQLPRMSYPKNPIGKDGRNGGRTDGDGQEAERAAQGRGAAQGGEGSDEAQG